MSNNIYTLRKAGSEDAEEIGRLAELDSSARPADPALLAEVDGRAVAALSLADGTVVADPFVSSAGAVDLLHARAHMLTGSGGGGRILSDRQRGWGLIARQH